MSFDEIKTLSNNLGKPKVELEKTNKMILENELGVKTIHVSISHEDDFSLAFVILEIWLWVNFHKMCVFLPCTYDEIYSGGRLKIKWR